MVQYLLKIDKLKFKQLTGKMQLRNLQQTLVAASSAILSLTAAKVKTPRKWFSLEGAGQHEECCAAAKTN